MALKVLRKLPPRKIAPRPNSNANRKPNPASDGGGQFSSGVIFRTPALNSFFQIDVGK